MQSPAPFTRSHVRTPRRDGPGRRGRSRAAGWGKCAIERAALACAPGVLACSDVGRDVTSPMRGIASPINRAILTAAAAASVNERGQFILSGPSEDGVSMLSEAQARSLAVAWAKEFGSFHRTRLERVHCAPIDMALLEPCPRAFLARSPYEPLGRDIPNYTRHLFGPYWLIAMCASGVPQVGLAVAAYATDVTIEGGRIRFPAWHGNEFVSRGIKRGEEMLLTPERAATLVADKSNRRVATVPELILPENKGIPQLARWRVTLEVTFPPRIGPLHS